jgi:hypothetical protein
METSAICSQPAPAYALSNNNNGFFGKTSTKASRKKTARAVARGSRYFVISVYVLSTVVLTIHP